MEKYYAVLIGRNPGIYLTWDACKIEVEGFEGAKYKSFSSLAEAKAYLNGKEDSSLSFDTPVAYIDGSYNKETEEYSFGGVLIIKGKVHKFNKKYPKDEYSIHRNVAGEIKGAGFIIQYAINHQITDLTICYDYMGIEKWYTGEWKANTPIAIAYVNFARENSNKINVKFVKIKSHTNDTYNDMADALAKEALGI